MKYGESVFDIVYLVFAIVFGLRILRKQKDAIGRLMGFAVLILGCGDAFHLIPRVLNYFLTGNFAPWLGVGKLITSITMTVFYLLMYWLWLKAYGKREEPKLSFTVYALTALRIVLCLFPQNGWLQNESPLLWAILRNIPFVALGCIIIVLFFQERQHIRQFRSVWLLV
jgi:hypothetical protein